MAQRIQVRAPEELTPERFRPVASPDGAAITERTRPIDTFVAPVDKQNKYAGTKISQLAQALSTIAPEVSRFAVQRGDQVDKNDLEHGQMKAAEIRAEGLTYKDAIDKGIIKPTDSKFFLRGVKEQLGQATAHDFGIALQEHLKSDPVMSTATDQKTIDAGVARFREEWLAQNVGTGHGDDKDFTLAFNATAGALQDNIRSRFGEAASDRLVAQSEQAHFATTKATFREDLDRGVPVQQTVAALNQRLSDLRAQGQNPMVLARSTTEALMALASELTSEGHGDSALDVAHAMTQLTVDGKQLRDMDPKISDAIEQLPDKINHQALEHAKLEKDRVANVREDRMEAAKVSLAQDLFKTKGANISSIMQSVSDIPDAPAALERTISAIRSTEDSPEARVKFQHQIWDDPKISIDDVFNHPGLGPNDVAYLVNQVQERDQKAQAAVDRALAIENRNEAREDRDMRRKDRAAAQTQAVVNEPSFRFSMVGFGKRVNDMMAMLDPGLTEDVRAEARSIAAQDWITYRAGEGKTADPAAQMKWLNGHLDQIATSMRAQLGEQLGGGGKPAERDATAAPKPPKTRVLSDSALVKYANGGGLTADAKATLRKYGVKPDKASIDKFFDQQASIQK